MIYIVKILFLIVAFQMKTAFPSFTSCRQTSIFGRCELCKIGLWGDRCEFTCRGHCDFSGCHQNNGSCFGCGAGYYTENCKISCPHNCYPTSEHNVYCHRVTGECLDGCRVGWWGSWCERRCSTGCEEGSCYQQDGKCIQACKPGWSGERCDVSCPTLCAQDKDGGKHCHWNTRKCRNGCIDGWWGKECSSNCNSKSCYHADGHCNEGCKSGWTGNRCDIRCPSGCRNEICAPGGKQECSKGCKTGFHGHHCNKTCNIHCVDRECFHDHHLKTTVCTNGCVEGWWSLDCREKCPDNCGDCDKDNGRCFAEVSQTKRSNASRLQSAICPLSLLTIGCMLLSSSRQ